MTARVLVTGVARSGTSWLGRALSHASDVIYYHEPDHIGGEAARGRPHRDPDFGAYPLIDPGQDANAFTPVWDMVFAGTFPFARDGGQARLRPLAKAARRMPRFIRGPIARSAGSLAQRMPRGSRHVVAKTVHSVMCLDWLDARYRPQVVVIQRHPLSVVSSWRLLDMPLFDLATRPAIRERFLDPLAIAAPDPRAGHVGRIAWHVGLLTQVVGDALERHPGWHLVDHEALCADPAAGMRDVCVQTGLPWSDGIATFLSSSDRPGSGMDPVRVTAEQPRIWQRRLTASDVEEAEGALAAFPRRGWVRAPATVQT